MDQHSSSTAGAAQQAALSAAAGRADATGRPVTVSSLTTATTVTVANPDGGFTIQENVLPVRVTQGSTWVPVSTTLHHDADGSLSPSAVPSDRVSFSGGGGTALATISADGTSLALSWPGRLPAPQVSGSSATYANVFPGVDLVLTATTADTGGFSEVLVVHSRAAALNPALAHLSFGVSTHGVQLRQNSDGSLVASAARAAGYYEADAPEMWDSSYVKPAGAALTAAGLAGPASSVAGPAESARLARVGTSVSSDGRALTLVPNAALLTSATTQFPAYIDPSFSWHTNDGGRQDFDEVQSSCPTASHYNDSSYWSLGVGYDGFGDCLGINGYAMDYYQVAVPSQIWGGHVSSATMNTQEAYTASCSATANVTLSWTGGMNKSTDWNNKPGDLGDQSTVNVPAGPSNSCNSSYDTSPSDWKGVGFSVMSAMTKAASGKWSNFTFRLWENGNSNDVDWKRFGPNPYVQIQYNQTPNTPSGLEISTTGSGGAECTSTPYPWVGHLASTDSTTMTATVSDKDGDQLGATFEYKQNSSSTWTSVTSTSTNITSGRTATAAIPSSFTNGLADGTEVDWEVKAYDGAPSAYGPDSGESSECHFYVEPSAPPPPTVTPGFSTNPNANSSVSFTIASNNTSSDAATEFVWGLDKQPSNTSPTASQTVKLASGQTSATVTVTVPGPGPHSLYAYTRDAAGNDSGMFGAADPASFSANADSNDTYASFGAALAAGKNYDNAMISNTSGASCGATTGDGNGTQFAASDLTAAGWKSGGTVTVDGVTFKLPTFGACGSDNLLAANQTIDLPAGSQGNSLVFLAAASQGDGAAPDASELPTSDTTAPYVPADTPVTGYECYSSQVGAGDCAVPSGNINYAGTSAPPVQSYFLDVPDWWDGQTDYAAVTMPHVVSGSGEKTRTVSLYAFAVPLNPNAPVSSVTLPDVGAVDQVGDVEIPGLHIFGVAVRNTTTSTPQLNGQSVASPAGQAWTGAFESPIEAAYGPPASGKYGNQTVRTAVSPDMTMAAGAGDIRIHLADPGFTAGDGDGPIVIGDASIAQQSATAGSGTAQAPTHLTFNGSTSVTIPAGGDVYSDPIPLPFGIAPNQSITVSLWIENGYTGQPAGFVYMPALSQSSGASSWISTAPSANTTSGDQTSDTSGTPFPSSSWAVATDLLSGVDVTTSSATVNGVASPGAPTVVVAGNNVTDAYATGNKLAADYGAPSIRLAGQLAGSTTGSGFGVVDGGIQANQVLADTSGALGNGVNLLARLDRDVLAEPDVGTVVIDEGLEDLLHAGTSASIQDELTGTGYFELAAQLKAWGITAIFATLTPCSGYAGTGSPADACSTTNPGVDVNRAGVNSVIQGTYGQPDVACATAPSLPCAYYADFDAAVSNGASTEALASADDTGDHANLTVAGYGALTGALEPVAGQDPLTANSPPTE